ncbi:Uncharacterised protein [Mycobacteroides abscessus subsp. abscessus]|nr:Uncharacterised protein [Mycobacteroides abscessus subsp. abscessus]
MRSPRRPRAPAAASPPSGPVAAIEDTSNSFLPANPAGSLTASLTSPGRDPSGLAI